MKRILPFFLIGLLLVVSCSRTVYTPVVHTIERTDTLWRTLMKRDSIRITDSVTVFHNGDTVLIREKTTERYEHTVTDTVREKIVERDTIPIMIKVEKPLSKWERTKQDWGGWAMGFVIVLSVVICSLKLPKK